MRRRRGASVERKEGGRKDAGERKRRRLFSEAVKH